MNHIRTVFAVLVLVTVAYAGKGPFPEGGLIGSVGRSVNALHPSTWIQKLTDNVPSVDDISFNNLVAMPANAAGALLNAVLQHSRLLPFSGKLFTPNASNIKLTLITPNGNISVPLNNPISLMSFAHLLRSEVTVLITGLPSNSEDPSDAITELVEAYRARYSIDEDQPKHHNSWEVIPGSLIVVELGNELNTFKKWATLNIQETGRDIAQAIRLILRDKCEGLHLIGTNVGAHVAGAVALSITQEIGQKVRRVTGLDPSLIFTKEQQIQSELKRGVAQFVDAIHTTHQSAGAIRNGDADFYAENSESEPENIFESFNRAIRYFAETVMPGSERKLMSVECNSMQDYENQQCYGLRVPMGYAPGVNTKGNYILKMNDKFPTPYSRSDRHFDVSRTRGSLFD